MAPLCRTKEKAKAWQRKEGRLSEGKQEMAYEAHGICGAFSECGGFEYDEEEE